MTSHQPSSSEAAQRRQDHAPIDREWLEKRALDYAARWETSAAGVSRLLERKIRERCTPTSESPDAALELVPGIVALLVDRGYVDDERFARSTFARLQSQGRSSARIRSQLLSRGVSESIIDRLAAERDSDHETRAAWHFAKRRRLGPFCSDPERRRRDRNRHLGVLARQGFDLELSESIVDAPSPPEPS